MKTIEEIKNEVAVKHGYCDWSRVAYRFSCQDIEVKKFLSYENEAMQQYAKQCCDELKEIDWIELLSDGSNQPEKTGRYFVVIKGKSDIYTYAKQYNGWFGNGQYYSDHFKNIGITHYSKINIPNTPNVVTTK